MALSVTVAILCASAAFFTFNSKGRRGVFGRSVKET